MILNKNLIDYLKSFNFTRWETILAWLLLQKHGVDCDFYLDDDDFFILVSNNIIERDYIHNKILVKIPIYEGEGQIKIRDHILELRDEVADNVDKFRKLFQGIRFGSMGDKQNITKLLTSWLIQHPNHTFDEVIKKTSHAISVMKAKNEIMYVPNADNFIYTYRDGVEVSKLSAIIDEDVFEMSMMI